MLNPWVILGIALAWVASLWAVGSWQRDDGATAEKTKWQSREIAQQAAAAAKIKELEDAARDEEARRVDEMTVLATNYAKGFRDAEDQRRRDVAAARDGALVLPHPCLRLRCRWR
ncbi:MAG: hypothetical protein IPM64_17620 [Phycisphaerales bacterium]|nr:hypothetical protein [Phycisphaerales bacterium]